MGCVRFRHGIPIIVWAMVLLCCPLRPQSYLVGNRHGSPGGAASGMQGSGVRQSVPHDVCRCCGASRPVVDGKVHMGSPVYGVLEDENAWSDAGDVRVQEEGRCKGSKGVWIPPRVHRPGGIMDFIGEDEEELARWFAQSISMSREEGNIKDRSRSGGTRCDRYHVMEGNRKSAVSQAEIASAGNGKDAGEAIAGLEAGLLKVRSGSKETEGRALLRSEPKDVSSRNDPNAPPPGPASCFATQQDAKGQERVQRMNKEILQFVQEAQPRPGELDRRFEAVSVGLLLVLSSLPCSIHENLSC